MGRVKRARLSAALILSLLCLYANGWVMTVDDGPEGPEGSEGPEGPDYAQDDNIATQLAMDEAQEEDFWPIFREYRYELSKLDQARRWLVDDFRGQGAALSVAQAREWVDGWLDNQRRRVKVTDQFVKRFRRVLPEAKVARLVMLESARAAAENAQALARVPATGVEEEVAR